MLQIKPRFSEKFPFVGVVTKWLLLVGGLTVIGLSVAFISYGLAVTTLFVGIAMIIKSAANFISPEKQAVKRALNRSVLVVLAGSLFFYGLLFFFSLEYP